MPKRKYTLKGMPKYIPFLQSYINKRIAKYNDLSDKVIRERLYKNLYQGYSSYDLFKTLDRVEKAVLLNEPEKGANDEYRQSYMDDLFAEYLSIPKEQRRPITIYGKNYIEDSSYTPTKNTENVKYKRINHKGIFSNSNGLEDKTKDALVTEAISGSYNTNNTILGDIDRFLQRHLGIKGKDLPLKIGENRTTTIIPGLGTHTIGRGVDPKKGEYVSYYDLWDMSPDSKGGEDKSLGIGKPIHIYDRIYLDDYYGVPKENRRIEPDTYYGGYLPEVIVTPKKQRKTLSGKY